MKIQYTLSILALMIFMFEVESQAQTMVDTYSFTGGTQIFVVDTCIGPVTFDVRGAKGGNQSFASGGLGGRVRGVLHLNKGDILYINVGLAGHNNQNSSAGVTVGSGGVASYLGGGLSGVGGGASDIRLNGTALNDRIVVAGGGGGAGGTSFGNIQYLAGGAGGGLTGGIGANWNTYPNAGGKGGSQTGGGAAGTGGCLVSPTSGGLGIGGIGTGDNAAGGGGGGGYYGGGGGCFSAGGGGSSYAYPSASSVIHNQGFQNGNGLVILTYDILTTSSTQIIDTCGSMVSPSGLYVWTRSGIYQDTILNAHGCDSIITVDLTFQRTYSTQIIDTCGSMVSPSGLYVWTTLGIYQDTILNARGCDSVITFFLTFRTTSSSQTISVCDSMISPSGLYVWKSSGIYQDTILKANDCDSILTIDLTILEPTFSIQTLSVCDRFMSPSGLYVWSVSGIYHDTIPNAMGCDSLIIVDLTVNTVDTAVTQFGNTLTANSPAAMFQWLDCNESFNVLTGETGPSFTPTVNGIYAVEIRENGCVDTSACFDITSVSISPEMMFSNISFYPNPNDGKVYINLGEFSDVTISVFSIDGKRIHYQENINTPTYELAINGAPGIYILEVNVENVSQQFKLVKKR